MKGEKKTKLQRGRYFSDLRSGGVLDDKAITALLNILQEHLSVELLPEEVYRKSNLGPKITEELTRLPLYLARGLKSWGGLVVAFPGTVTQLATEYVGTPYLRRLLYPILDLHRRLQEYSKERLPCIYILGARFPEIFLRKFHFLDEITAHVIVLTTDLLTARKTTAMPDLPAKVSESWVQAQLCHQMLLEEGLEIPSMQRNSRVGLLSYELPTSEGTKHPERLDILGYDKKDHSLVAFEIKGPNCKRVELENLFLQGLEHRNWLERNKMAVKFIFDGPRGARIDTRKRVRLFLGFFADYVPGLFYELRGQAKRKDRYLEIEFVKFVSDKEQNLKLACFK